jgi:DNA-binding response OmpR family regulator
MCPDAPPRRVLIVEDDLSIRELLRLHLAMEGFDLHEACDGRAALARVRSAPYDVLILDLALSGLDGLSLCRTVRAEGLNKNTPILMLSARDTESDRVLALESGADDCLTKPFGVRELLARIGAILRRNTRSRERAEPSRRVVASDVALDGDRREALVRGQPVRLTKQEFDLVYLLAARRGIVFSRAALLANIWRGDPSVTERTIDTVVSRVRRKIERAPHEPQLILTAWGVGYKFIDAE